MAVAGRSEVTAVTGILALDDVIGYSESAVRPNTLVRFDPKTQKFQTWIIPAAAGSSAT